MLKNMSVPTSINLLKLSSTNSHLNFRRLALNSTSQTKNSDSSKRVDQIYYNQDVQKYNKKQETLDNCHQFINDKLQDSVPSKVLKKNKKVSNMGSSNSKCSNVKNSNQLDYSNGWINKNCRLPHLNQPYFHQNSCSMMNLNDNSHFACLDYTCSCNLHSMHNYNSNNGFCNNNNVCKLNNQANYFHLKNCGLHAINNNSHCGTSLYNLHKQKFDSEEPYWLQQAKKTNKKNPSDEKKFGLFTRNLFSMRLNELPSSQQQFKMSYHTHVVSGSDLLREPNLNKDLAYTNKEREKYGIKGLIPPAVRSQELQAKIAINQFRKLDGSLTKYMYLRDLQDFNKRLFYRLLIEYVEELMPIVYTPVVGDACLKYSELYKRPRGLFITKKDLGHVHEILNNWLEKDIKAIVVTDGERILGLGDLGANGMGIPVGKLALYSALAAIPPHLTLPITLDVGTNNEKLINSEFYIGLKEPRERGPIYDKLLDEFMEAVARKWGRSCLIQFEDFGNSNAFKLLQKYRNHYCTFNDDIQGTASVAVAGVMAACKRMKKKVSQQKFFFMGAGGAALGISDLLVMAMQDEGLTVEEARNNIFLMDSKGLVSQDREDDNDLHKMQYAKPLPNYHDLEKLIDLIKPSCLIGVCAQPAVFTPEVLRKMALYNESPLIFPLSNPTSKAECTAEQAYVHTDGKAIFASGSPFDIIKYKNKTFIPGQGNNSYIFPGIALAVMSCSVNTIPEETFLVAAKALADQVTAEELEEGRIYPCLKKIQQVSVKIATKVAQYFFVQGLSTIRPEPEDKELFIRQHQYSYDYDH